MGLIEYVMVDGRRVTARVEDIVYVTEDRSTAAGCWVRFKYDNNDEHVIHTYPEFIKLLAAAGSKPLNLEGI